MKEITLSIQGMKCDGCARNVEEKLRGVRGVDSVDVSLGSHSAKVQAGDHVSESELLSALNGTKFKVAVAQ